MSDTVSIREILDFWFLPLDHPDHGGKRDIWWQSTPGLDAEIETRFSVLVELAIAGELDHWRKSPDGTLALILLCDQFTRNIWRKTARAFSGDAKACESARYALAHNHPVAYPVAVRQFFFMPF